MNVSEIIQRACMDKKDLAELAGLSHDYVRQLSRGKEPRNAGPEALAKLAEALAGAADGLREDAQTLGRAAFEARFGELK